MSKLKQFLPYVVAAGLVALAFLVLAPASAPATSPAQPTLSLGQPLPGGRSFDLDVYPLVDDGDLACGQGWVGAALTVSVVETRTDRVISGHAATEIGCFPAKIDQRTVAVDTLYPNLLRKAYQGGQS